MTVILKNHKNGKEREFDDKDEAEDTRSELIGIGAKPENLEIIENGQEDTSDSEGQEGGGDESQDKTNGTQPKEVEPVEEQRQEGTEELHAQNFAQAQEIPAISDIEDKARSVIQNLSNGDMNRLVWDPEASRSSVPYNPSNLPYNAPEPSAEAFDMFATIIEGQTEVQYSVVDVDFTKDDEILGCTVRIQKQSEQGTKQLIGVKTRNRNHTNLDHWRERLYSKARRNALKQDIPPTWISALLRQYEGGGYNAE